MRVVLHNPSSVAVTTAPCLGFPLGARTAGALPEPGFGNAELNLIWPPDTRRSAGINQGVKAGLGAWEEAIKS